MKEFKARRIKAKRQAMWFYVALTIPLPFAPLILHFSDPNGLDIEFFQNYGLVLIPLILYLFYCIKILRRSVVENESYKLTIAENFLKREMKGRPDRILAKKDIHSIAKNTVGAYTLYGFGNEYIHVPSFVENMDDVLIELRKIRPIEEKIEPFKIEFENEDEGFIAFVQRHSNQSRWLNLAVSSGGIVILSLVHLYFYFNLFGVKIYNYLEVQEIVLSFMNIWKECVLVFILFALFLWRWEGLRLLITKDKRPKNITLAFIIQFIGFGGFMTVFMFYGLDLIPNQKEPSLNETIQYQALVLGGVCIFPLYSLTVTAYFINLVFFNSERPISPLLTVILAICFAMTLVFFENYFSYKLLVNGYPKSEVTLFRSDDTPIIKTSEDLVFIGETNNYLFFYDIKSKQSTVVTRSSIEREHRVPLRRGL